jgi:hypothetical protein
MGGKEWYDMVVWIIVETIPIATGFVAVKSNVSGHSKFRV